MGVVSQFMHDPREEYIQADYRIFHYLKDTFGEDILFRKGIKISLEAYKDIDDAGSPTDRRSTFGYCTFLGTT